MSITCLYICMKYIYIYIYIYYIYCTHYIYYIYIHIYTSYILYPFSGGWPEPACEVQKGVANFEQGCPIQEQG